MRLLLLFLAITILSCKQVNVADEITIQGDAFGTTYAVKYFGPEQDAIRIKKGIDSVIYAVNKSMSTYLPDSDISKINRGDSTIVIDDMFKDVYSLSRKLNKATSGYFDPTVGTLRNAYGFGDTEALKVIDSTALDSLMKYVGWDKVTLSENDKIEKTYPEIYFDFNAVAKGYGVDRVGIFMNEEGYRNFLVDIGGEIVASGFNERKQESWIVGIENLDSPLEKRTHSVLVGLRDKAMAGSGNYRKNRIDETTGEQYVHTLNPLTGSAERSDVLSATIIAVDCATADAWATSCMAMGLDRAKEALKGQDVEAYLVYDGGVYMTEGFEEYIQD
ncbi:thiamine biosynthesis lipoprotein [Dokdonia sp. Hel_I_63]|uniref:FAD:protein FMN transferase n=1 Tax=Dokdonia sp. Hel_I_63 TaxID=1249996 RepID=UPI00119C860A|nr:FAD:protein FMN transferase [Dokdonia sp. Hel_I_63]TVZ22059.1 thiamine biosynthesis lipoprotein [Dokdonia sp. Hel_I_63]